MQENPICVDESDTLQDVISTLDTKQVSHLLVQKNGDLTGVISRRDIYRRIYDIALESTGFRYSELQFKTIKACEIMTPKPVVVAVDDDIALAVEVLLQRQFHCVPVLDQDKKPVGIVTAYDLLKEYYEGS